MLTNRLQRREKSRSANLIPYNPKLRVINDLTVYPEIVETKQDLAAYRRGDGSFEKSLFQWLETGAFASTF